MDIEITKVEINRNTRVTYQGIDELMRSIKETGLLQPIVVSKVKDKYNLIAGHRRFLACRKLGHKTIKAEVLNPSDDAEAEIMTISENLHRKDVTPYELALGVNRLIASGLNIKEISVRIQKSVHFIKQTLAVIERTPAKIAQKISYADPGKQSSTGWSIGQANRVLIASKSNRLTEGETEYLFQRAHKNAWSINKINLVAQLARSFPIKQACDHSDKFRVVSVRIPVPVKTHAKIKRVHGTVNEFISKKVSANLNKWANE